jgi:uncharacterized membrane protein
MEAFILLMLLLLVVTVPIGIVIALVRLHGRVRILRDDLDRLNLRVDLLREPPETVAPTRPHRQPSAAPAPAPGPIPSPPPAVQPSAVAAAPPLERVPPSPRMSDVEPPLLEPIQARTGPAEAPVTPWLERLRESAPIDWEQFMGVKLFAWVGGLAMFLGVVFFVKHAFDQGLIPPEMRVALGFLAGLAMVAGGAVLHRRNYQMPAQTLCATGILILYGTTFACRSIYHFEWFGLVPTFLLMALITVAALLLALRLEALVVAILGLVGGFLTPALLSTGQDNPLGLFSYIALLDVGLLALAFHRRWHFLALMAAVGTLFLQLGWMSEFFVRERYFDGNKILIAMTVFATFTAIFEGAWWWGRHRAQLNPWLSASAILMPALALLVVPYWFGFESLGNRPGLLFAYVLLLDLGLLALAWEEKRLLPLEPAAGGAVFLLLTIWTARHLNFDLFYWGLGLVFAFALLHAVIPLLRRRWQPGLPIMWWGHLFPLVALLLMLIPLFRLEPAPFGVWPFILLLNLLVVGLALAWASAVGLVAAVALTLLVASCWILSVPPAVEPLAAELLVIGVFAVFFIVAGAVVARRFTGANGSGAHAERARGGFGALEIPAEWLPQIPALSAVLPFTLLILVSQRLALPDPSALFGLALLLVALMLGISRSFGLTWLPVVGLGCVLALEHVWHFGHFDPDQAVTPLIWHAVFILVFAGFPFLFWRRLSSAVLPWAAAALAGPLHFYLVHRHVHLAWPMDYMGILPILFAVPSAAGLAFLVRQVPADAPGRNTLLAWFGGATLFFVTLVFPIQFDRQWITVGWALEGMALLWLFHRIPHQGLRLTGFGLLTVAFVRLALNPAVLTYHARGDLPILNWYLYAYGVVIAALFLGARLLAPPHHLIFQSNARSILNVFGTILAFLLLNIQIADYFTAPGASTLIFQFSGDFGRDMTCSIAWAAFALGLLVFGIWKRLPPARYAALTLLSVTLLKLFFHDLSRLSQLYRIGAFIGVAIIAMLASFLYQRSFIRNAANHDSTPRIPDTH